jgi:hypothetical protein
MEGMLDNLSQPVAFATIPLAFDQPSGPVREGSLSSDTDIDDTGAGGSAPVWKGRIGGAHLGGLGEKEKGKEEDLVDLGGDSDVEVLADNGLLTFFNLILVYEARHCLSSLLIRFRSCRILLSHSL